MGLDIRVPLGAMFTLLGVLLTAFGLFGNKTIYQQTLGIDVNLDWGVVLLIFGLIMLFLGLRAGNKDEVLSEGGTEEPPPIRH
jgi:multisubunit Na+/H+ antiporter MnhG subunit